LKAQLSPRDLALTLAAVALWGYTFVPIRIALDEVPPFALAALRFLFAAVPMAFFVRPPAMPWGNVVAYGFAIGVCQFGLLFLGIKLGMPAGLSSLVIQVQVFFTIGLAVAFAALAFAFEGGWAVPHAVASMSLLAWGCVLVMSYGATLFGFGTWNALLHRYPTALISPFALLIPVSGLASGALFLGESLAPTQIAGVALVFAGLVVNVYGLKVRAWLARRM
jgi:O-acetylserine/cysteine efflux transporter